MKRWYKKSNGWVMPVSGLIQPKLAIPMHYGAIVGGEGDAETFKNALEGKVDVLILPKS